MAEYTSSFEQGIPVVKYTGSFTTLMQAPMPGIKELVDGGYKKIILDAEGISYLNSQGLSSIINTHRACHKSGVQMVLASVKPDVMKVIRIARANLFIPIFDDIKTALKEVQYASGATLQTKTKEVIIVIQQNLSITADLSEVLHDAHQTQNYDFITKTSLPEATDFLGENDAQLVIIDVNFNAHDVETFIAGLALGYKHNNIPILVATPRARYEEAFQFILDGANDFLTHPFDEFETPTRIRNVLQTYYILKSGSAESQMSGLRLSRSRK